MSRAIGMIEFKTTPAGITAADAMVKTSEVEIVEAQTVCPGKYIAIITGDLSAVKAAVDTAVTTYEDKCIDSFVLGNPHESIFPAIYGTTQVEEISALGILETYDAASIIEAADQAAKTAIVDLIELRIAKGMCGKSYMLLTGEVSAVEASIERAKELFGCDYVNVQPHSGAQANMAVMFAMLEPGDKIMGMNLDHGGHLTHGSPVNMSGKYFDVAHYGVNEDGVIDYDEVLRIAKEHQPKLIVAGASAYARTIDFKRFREIADEVGSYLMVDMAHIAGLVAAGLHPSPIPYAHVVTTTTHKTLRGPRGGMILSSQEVADKYNFNKAIFPGIQGGPLMHVIAAKAVCFKEALQPEFKVYQQNIIDNAQALCKGLMDRGIKIVSGGTDNHLMLVDLTNYDLTGKAVEKLLDSVNITCNKNTIPNDPKSPFVTSGVRLGTPAVTSRGLNTDDMDQIAEAIAVMIKEGEPAADRAKAIVKSLTEKYPLK